MSTSSEYAARKLKAMSGQNISAPSSGRNTANSSPIENSSSNPTRFSLQHAANGSRMGAGSPSYDGSNSGSRLYSKRAREIQQEEGVGAPGLWGPISNSSASSLLREREPPIPEHPLPESSDAVTDYTTPIRRARAGTLPSRFPPGTGLPTPPPPSQIPNTSRPSPATTPFNAPLQDTSLLSVPGADSKSRNRAGSLQIPPPTNYVNAFGSGLYGGSNTWGTRGRSATNIGLPSPSISTFSKDEEHMAGRTLDYLGLVDTPQTSRAQLSQPLGTLLEGERATSTSRLQPYISDSPNSRANRIRSYSVNAKEKYAEDEEEEENLAMYGGSSLGVVAAQVAPATTQAHAALLAQYSQGLAPSRSRARTVSALDTPPANRMRSYLATPSKLGDAMTSASDLPRPDYFEYNLYSMQRPVNGDSGLVPIEESQLEGPTRALWLGNIPTSTTSSSLTAIFHPFGPIESVRVLTHKNCGFINFKEVSSAIQAKNTVSGREIFPGAGPARIGFAKPSSASGTPTPNGGAFDQASSDPSGQTGGNDDGLRDRGSGSRKASDPIDVPELSEVQGEILSIVRDFGATDAEVDAIGRNLAIAVAFDQFKPEIPSIPEPSHTRVHDAPKLRDIRKRIDNGNCSQVEIEEIAENMLPEIAELSSDYLGNTVVQKLFEFCSEEMKEKMLDKIGPHLAEIGIHKNGTWAGQKIIDVAKTHPQMAKITGFLRPYTVALFLDQYGNYVLQCCLRFTSPLNDYIFETMTSRLWEIAQGRYGARAMRACLESHHSNKNQQRMLAAVIALHSVQLATNANGALLLTWFLDTCNFPKRRTVLAPRLVPHLVHLCTHKVAYLTVLKVINQKNEPEARDIILRAMFFSPNNSVLEDILKDQSCGATLIFKVLTTPFFDEEMRADVIKNIRDVLTKLKAAPSQGYKRLMDEVGMSTRNGLNNNNNGNSNGSRDAPTNGSGTPHTRRSQNNSSVNTPVQAPRNVDSPAQPQFFNGPPMFNPPNIGSPGFFSPNGQVDPQTIQALQQLTLNPSVYGGPNLTNALQYQLLQQQQLVAAGGRPVPFFDMPRTPFSGQQGNNEQFRPGQGGNAIPPPGMGSPMMGHVGVNLGFNSLGEPMMNGYGAFNGMNGVPVFGPQNQAQQSQPNGQGNGGRRGGRVRNSGHGNRQHR
ncbi:hypothetical protein EX30DRAFT_367650 [Ascodesmis nigricans]|uniref:ARM repeat-containing protein n=1 Tax=Ascodesmis nigricans TaxID=341454 RepID=A0A4S2N5R7_9PEZI|nr:hypothetical protein EX30DRAFT_367650 [Ascodesmis nigricans]